ncbi:putative phage abortive infection protein [Aliarcobacter butzleri]|uniref:putative phage abortive infection protein n=1 Tax=Aliarcobacter butzleri TaxID=28197 RepID=UPI0021B3E963|nr:putative phage abortive infection protein [Aliarcobacter butzleri]MCT7566902.1 putative phage abortive infection protein [Aliarcobacter butzleri]MCT7570831.1 putative phage abortive infection protein [Aliarcobacter butzleri]MCT7633380.1 putative phage abortive infection protein [Aliarcobacter butzleri]
MKINLKELKSNIFQLIIIALMCLIVVGCVAFLISTGKTFKITDLGSLGDFFGGILNPIFSFLAFLALLTTIVLQASELKATRKELKKSAKAQKKQSKSLKLQNKATKLQMFENTFFKLFDLFNLTKNTLHVKIQLVTRSSFSDIIVNDITYSISSENIGYWEKYNGNSSKDRAIKLFLEIYRFFYYKEYDYFNINYENLTGAYFGQIYQILKFIDESNIQNKQRYVNIFRAQFTKYELVFLFYHCLGSIGKSGFKKLVEDYEFFEHIVLNEDIEKQLLEYDKKAFGKNEKILDKYNELKESKE